MTSQNLYSIFVDDNSSGVTFKNRERKKQIIQQIELQGESTITDLSKELNNSVPKITSLVNELIVAGLLKDSGKYDSTGGRKASLYTLVADACFFVGIDVKKSYVNCGLLDFKKQLVSSTEMIPFKLENTRECFQALLTIIKSFINNLNPAVAINKILSVGISLSGRINNTTGYSYSYFHFNEEPLSAIIQKEIGIPTYLENDSRAMAYGEFCNVNVKNKKNVLFVNIDYGIGIGVLIDGKLYYGKSGFAGEFGHIPLFDNEILCHCGKKGCLETEASGAVLLKRFKEKIKQGSTSSALKKKTNSEDISLPEIIAAVRNEDILCMELVAEIGEKIGKGIALLLNIFNPELLLVGGALSETGECLLLPIRSAVNKYSLSLVNNDTQLKLSNIGEKAGVIGVCLIARNKILGL